MTDRDEQKAQEIVAEWSAGGGAPLHARIASALREARREEREKVAAIFDARASVLKARIDRRATQEFTADDAALGQAQADASAIRALEDK